jgi:outer membrane receptor for monomeric catechols
VLGTAYAEVMAGPWSLLTRATMTGSQTVLTERFSGRRVPIGGYAVADLMLSFEASRNLNMYLSATNLFDTNYQTGFDKPGLPLRLIAGVRINSR